MKPIKIPNINMVIGGEEVFVVAEIGKGFIQSKEDKTPEEYLRNAKELVKLAKQAGATAVKFQIHNVEDEQLNIEISSPHFVGSGRYSWVKRNTIATPFWFWQELKRYCEDLGILFFATPMSRGAARILEKLGVSLWKVGGGDVMDFILLDYLAKTQKPIILSSGMSTLEDVDMAMDFLKKRNCEVILLHCVSKYPSLPSDLNLNTIPFLQKRYNCLIGFSDHSLGWDSAVMAVSLGACVIEKHFSKDRGLWGSDHQVSMLPWEMKKMNEFIQQKFQPQGIDLGREEKILNDGEAVFRPIYRKSLMAGRDIKAGEILAEEDIYAMRPQKFAGGLSSEEYEKVLGKKVVSDLKKYDPITWENLL